jgi:hypothetical protein
MDVRLFNELQLLRDLNERRELEKAKHALEAELAHVSRVALMGELTASIDALVGGDFFTNARTRVITSPACLPSRAIRSRHARALSRLGGPPASQRRPASEFALTAGSGCRTSCAAETPRQTPDGLFAFQQSSPKRISSISLR